MNITVWNEYHSDRPGSNNATCRKVYPKGIHGAIADIFEGKAGINVTTAVLEGEDNGLPEALLDRTDVLIYWAHCLHDKVSDETVERIYKRVNEGMGIVFLHSSHCSKPIQRLLGTTGSLIWREDNKHERLYNVNPTHPIAHGVPERIFIPKDEMYGEYFDIPQPDELIFLGWYPGGEIFRSGWTKTIGKGRLFYFQPGHETFPIYYMDTIKKIIYNAAVWTANTGEIEIKQDASIKDRKCKWVPPMEKHLINLKRKG